MLNIAVCDDNPQFANLLMRKICTVCNSKLPEEIEYSTAPVFNGGADVLRYLEHSAVSILFLDIDMPDIDGFQLAQRLVNGYPDILIVFVSSHEDYVYSSFEYSPFRFIRKSHINEELEPVLLKAIDKLVTVNTTMCLDTTDGEQIVRLWDILYFEGDRNYYLIRTANGKEYRCRGTLNNIEDQLEKLDFFRINPTYIVNEEHIESYSKERFVRMKNGVTLEISTRKLIAFKRKYMYFLRKRVADQ